MTDYTKGGGIAAAIVEAVAYFFLLPRDSLTRFEVFLLCYLVGVVSFFAYLAYKKHNEPNPSLKPISSWDSNELLAGFLGAFIALTPTVIIGTLIGR